MWFNEGKKERRRRRGRKGERVEGERGIKGEIGYKRECALHTST